MSFTSAKQGTQCASWALLRRWAGLIRGAVSVALVYYYFDPKGQSEDSHRATLIATTLVVVMFSITIFGALTKPLLDFTLGGPGARSSCLRMLAFPVLCLVALQASPASAS